MPEILKKFNLISMEATILLVSVEQDNLISQEKSIQSWGARWALLELMIEKNLESSRLEFIENSGPLDSKNEFSFSISHTFPYCVAVISKIPVGIDIEKKSREADHLMDKFLKKEEISLIKKLGISPIKAFSIKEACFKSAKGKIQTLKEPIQILSDKKAQIDNGESLKTVHLESIEHGEFEIIIAFETN